VASAACHLACTRWASAFDVRRAVARSMIPSSASRALVASAGLNETPEPIVVAWTHGFRDHRSKVAGGLP
jgi:hypothetical protein